MNGGKLQGGSAWRPEKYFYLNNTTENGYIFIKETITKKKQNLKKLFHHTKMQ